MSIFYIRHHYLSIVRSKSFSGQGFAFIIVLFIVAKSLPSFYRSLDDINLEIMRFLNTEGQDIGLLIVTYFFFELLLRTFFNRPRPRLKHYLLLTNKTKSIASQYLFTSLFGIVTFLFFSFSFTMVVKTFIERGIDGLYAFALFLTAHFISLFIQFGTSKEKVTVAIFIGILIFAALSMSFVPVLVSVLLSPLSIFLLIISIYLAFVYVDRHIRKRVVTESNGISQFRKFLPSFSFKNPYFQLEWSLVVRNKRAKTNLLLGALSLLILAPFLSEESPGGLMAFIFFLGTSFFIIQHGVYSLGWEGSYFDFLVTHVQMKKFLSHRYIFYAATCFLGFILFLIPGILRETNLVLLASLLLYNIGVTIPLVLFRSVYNSSKLELSENSMTNYNGMMTGPIMVTSMMVIIIPLILAGVGEMIFEGQSSYFLGALGLIGIALRGFILNQISVFVQNKKYHLSQSFKS